MSIYLGKEKNRIINLKYNITLKQIMAYEKSKSEVKEGKILKLKTSKNLEVFYIFVNHGVELKLNSNLSKLVVLTSVY